MLSHRVLFKTFTTYFYITYRSVQVVDQPLFSYLGGADATQWVDWYFCSLIPAYHLHHVKSPDSRSAPTVPVKAGLSVHLSQSL